MEGVVALIMQDKGKLAWQRVDASAATGFEFDAVMIVGNGVIASGVDLEQAYLRLELVEHLAKLLKKEIEHG